MLDVSFSCSSEQPLLATASDALALKMLHDIDLIMHLNPDCKGVKLISDPSASPKEYKIEDALAFIPKKLWAGGVSYTALFTPLEDGCDILVHAPGGFESTNRWRIAHKADGARTVKITTDAKCSKAFAIFVKKHLGAQHSQLQKTFNQRVESQAATITV